MHSKILLLLAASLPASAMAQAIDTIADATAEAESANVQGVSAAAAAGPAAAGPASAEEELEELIVTAQRQRGAVEGDIQPEMQLGPRDIRALGASSIAELVEALGPELRSGRGSGPPVVLVDGRRISGFQEIRNLPPEAIERVDILPEEVALKYGYRADQRVINFVLRQRFRAVTVELEPSFTTGGGRGGMEVDASLLRIQDGKRLNLEGEFEHQAMLRESQRSVAGDPNTDPAIIARNAQQRSLQPQTNSVQIGGTYAGHLTASTAFSVNGRFEATDSRSLNGLPREALASGAEASPLQRLSENRQGRIGTALNGLLGDWRWSFTGSYDISHNETETDRDLGTSIRTDQATSRNQVVDADLVLNGSVLEVPAGRLQTTLKAGVRSRDLESESVRGALVTNTELGRTEGNFQASFDMPVSSRRNDVLSAIGDLSLNANVGLDTLSDFGTLITWGYGFNWRPTDKLRFIGSGTHEEGAPSIQQLGNPFVATPNVRVFDFLTGQTVDITRFDGGNPDLVASSRRMLKLGTVYEPFEGKDINIRADFLDTKVTNQVAGFPTATPEIEAAFPERFVRDSAGTLISIDNRPVNFAGREQQELRWGISWSQTIRPSARERAAIEQRQAEMRKRVEEAVASGRMTAQQAAALPPGVRPQGAGGPGGGQGAGAPRGPGGGGPRMAGPGGMRPGEGRVNLTMFHTVKFRDEILIRDGVPVLDLLNGSATGNSGVSRHEVEMRAFGGKNGLGGRASATWRSATTVLADPGGVESPEDLFFSPYMTTELRMWVDFGQRPGVAQRHPFLRGARLAVGVNNLFDAKPQVRDRLGETPISYQPDLLNPIGRSAFISFRKIFFPGFRPPAGGGGGIPGH